MPRTTETGNAALQIELASPPDWTFTPGDTVIGTVLRNSPILTPEATVRLALVGRVKTKITTKGSTSRSRYRARWHMFSTTTAQVLFRGPLHLGYKDEDGLSWSFSLGVPLRPADTALKGHHSEEGFLPLDKDGISQHTIPGTFFSQGRGWYTSSVGFVEYFLEAWLRYHHRGGRLYEVHKATCPVTIRPYPPIILPSQDVIQRREIAKSIRSQRLLPGMEDVDLTFKQKAQKLFGSSKVPGVHYGLEICWPRVIQLGDSISLKLNIVPKREMTSESIQNIGLMIRVNWVKMVVKSITTVLAPKDMRRLLTEDDSHTVCHYLNLEKVFDNSEVPIRFSAEEVNDPVDIGGLFRLVLHSHGLSAGEELLASVSSIQPDIFTYNLRHSHLLELSVSLTIAGETHTVPMSTELMILPTT